MAQHLLIGNPVEQPRTSSWARATHAVEPVQAAAPEALIARSVCSNCLARVGQ